MSDPVIVAFLQNMWVRDPERARAMITRDQTGKLRQRMIQYSLFAGCLTGRRLTKIFGSLCDEIIWDEANPTISDNPRDYFPADALHIESVLEKHNPSKVVCFTRAGEPVIKNLCDLRGIEFFAACHPAAHGAATISTLQKCADNLRASLK